MPCVVLERSPDWISGYEVRTVLLALSLTPESVYEALREGRGYATLDRNLRIGFALNGEVVGSTLSKPAASFEARIDLVDPDGVPSDAITLVEIVSDGGRVVASLPGLAGVTAWTAPVRTG